MFAGCFGWVGEDGALDLAMVIRSIVVHPGGAYVGAGGGITWRSDADAEVAEVGIKARGAARRDRTRSCRSAGDVGGPVAWRMRSARNFHSTIGSVTCPRPSRPTPPCPLTAVATTRTPFSRSGSRAGRSPIRSAPEAPRTRVRASTCWACSRTRPATCTWATPRTTPTSTSVARFWRHRGYNVLNPIGWDSFGLPAENAAIQRGADPREWTYANIAQQKRSFREYGSSYDWSRILHTSDPEYYRWNQWLFQRLYERGLAYRKDSPVNWCPNDQTVLANEQVVDGRCERCGAEVVKKKLTQWYFKITDYADRLLDDLNQLEGFWPQQGHPDAAQLDRPLGRCRHRLRDRRTTPRRSRSSPRAPTPCTARRSSSSRPTAIWPPNWPPAASAEVRMRFQDYLAERRRRSTEIERQSTDRPKTGVFLERYAINPINGERLPIWAADYVLADYGHGAVMAVPAHDQRDLDFARAFDLPVRVVVDTTAPITGAIPVIELDENGVPIDPGADADSLDEHRPRRDRHRADRRGSHDQLRPVWTDCPSATRSRASPTSSPRRGPVGPRSPIGCGTG